MNGQIQSVFIEQNSLYKDTVRIGNLENSMKKISVIVILNFFNFTFLLDNYRAIIVCHRY